MILSCQYGKIVIHISLILTVYRLIHHNTATFLGETLGAGGGAQVALTAGALPRQEYITQSRCRHCDLRWFRHGIALAVLILLAMSDSGGATMLGAHVLCYGGCRVRVAWAKEKKMGEKRKREKTGTHLAVPFLLVASRLPPPLSWSSSRLASGP